MSHLYVPVLALHVIVAVLGIGSIASVALVAGTGRRAGRGATDVSASLQPLLRYSAISLAVMLVTGALLDFFAGGAFHEQWWFRGSALLLVATGALHGQARRAMRAGLANAGKGPNAGNGDVMLRRVERIAYVMCALVAVIAVLMEVKPF
jgi:uncharacterized membrane protein